MLHTESLGESVHVLLVLGMYFMALPGDSSYSLLFPGGSWRCLVRFKGLVKVVGSLPVSLGAWGLRSTGVRLFPRMIFFVMLTICTALGGS